MPDGKLRCLRCKRAARKHSSWRIHELAPMLTKTSLRMSLHPLLQILLFRFPSSPAIICRRFAQSCLRARSETRLCTSASSGSRPRSDATTSHHIRLATPALYHYQYSNGQKFLFNSKVLGQYFVCQRTLKTANYRRLQSWRLLHAASALACSLGTLARDRRLDGPVHAICIRVLRRHARGLHVAVQVPAALESLECP